MNLDVLKEFAHFLRQSPPLKLRRIQRIGDNLFKMEVNENVFYIDLSRAKSTIFTTSDILVATRLYQAPFDKSLQKYCNNTILTNAQVDGDNRILRLFLQAQNHYKTSETILQMEFTGRNTNLILLDSRSVVLDALHHITKEQSFREVRISKPLIALPQPQKIPAQHDKKIELFRVFQENYKELNAKTLQSKIHKSQTLITQKIKRLNQILHSLENKENLESQSKQESSLGQLIVRNLYLHPHFKGTHLELEGINVSLPKKAQNLSAAAQIFFENAKKLNKRAQNIHLQEQNLSEKIAFYENLLKMIQNVTNLSDLEILNSNLHSDRLQNSKKSSKQKQEVKPYESFFVEGFKVSFGKNESENLALLKDAKSDDVWLHIRDVPSSHCIIHCGKAKISDIILYKVAEILVGLRQDSYAHYTIDYTRRKFVKLIQGANVIYGKEQTLELKKD